MVQPLAQPHDDELFRHHAGLGDNGAAADAALAAAKATALRVSASVPKALVVLAGTLRRHRSDSEAAQLAFAVDMLQARDSVKWHTESFPVFHKLFLQQMNSSRQRAAG